MKNLLLTLCCLPVFAAAQSVELSGKNFRPEAIEISGKQNPLSDAEVPFELHFLDTHNAVWKEYKDQYYVLHHCVYQVKDGKMTLEFLKKKKPENASPVYEIVQMLPNRLVLKKNNEIIHLKGGAPR